MDKEQTTVTREGLPVSALPDLERRVAELNRRASKLNVPALRVAVSAPRWEEVPAHVDEGGWDVPARRVEVIDVEVTGETPHLAGWALAAVLDHDGPETVTNRVPGVEADLTPYRDAPAHCDHCGTTRRRLETFVLLREDGRLTQVGRDCLADFLGGASPASVLFLAGWVREVGDALDEYLGRSPEPAFAPAVFFATAATCVRVGGWVSRTSARERGGPATADDVWDVLNPPEAPSAERRRWLAERRATDTDRALAAEALAWAQALDPADPSEYLSNLGRVARKPALKRRDSGLATSAVPSYLRAAGKEAERKAAAAKSEHFGEVGTRYRDLILAVVGVSYHETQFGTSTLVRFADAEGRRMKWWASGSRSEYAQGERVAVDATVKAHDEYKGVKETVLTRVAPATLDKAAAKAAAKALRVLAHAMKHVDRDRTESQFSDAYDVLWAAQRRVTEENARAQDAGVAQVA